MSDKYLTVKEWQKFAKDKAYKDAALVKALAVAEKSENADSQQQLKVLFELEEAGRDLFKLHKGDKKLESYLEDVYKALKKYRKDAEKTVDKQAKQEDKEGAEDEDSPVLLTAKMIPLLRQVKKGDEMQALIAVGGKSAAVLLSKRVISPSRLDLLKNYLGESSVKRVKGLCIFEENAYTFVVEGAAAGLARKIKAALLAQVELRLKVRVRGEDPNDVEDDGDGEEPADEVGAEDEGGAAEAPAPQVPAGTIPPAPPLPPDALKSQYDKQMSALEPRVLAALKAQQGDVSKIRAVAEFARGKADEGNYKAALAALESLEKLLPAAAPAQVSSPDPAGVDPAVAFNARLAALLPKVKDALAAGGPDTLKLKVSEAGVSARKKAFDQANELLDDVESLLSDGAPQEPEQASASAPASQVKFMQARLAWDKTRKQVQTELRALEAAVLEECRDEDDFETLKKNTQVLYGVLDVLDERLIDTLDELLNAGEPADRDRLHQEARLIVEEYKVYVKTSDTLHVIADNGFVETDIMGALNTCLADLSKQLQTA